MSAKETFDVESQDGEDYITSLRGREIYTKGGLYVGEVSDVRLDFTTQDISHVVVDAEVINPNAFVIEGGRKGVLIPYRWVRSVGDIVLVNNIGPTSKDKKRSAARSD